MAVIRDFRKNFEALVASEKLAHAYIFHGPDLERQFLFAKELAHFLERESWEMSKQTLSDALFVDSLGENIGIDTARSFLDFLYQSPNVSSRRLVAVKDAGRLNHLAQNALLKLAEEPPPHGMIILSVSDVGGLSPILASRFARIYFAEQNKSANGKWQMANGGAEKLVERFLMEGARGKSELLKKLIKEDGPVDDFVVALMAELSNDVEKNWRALKELNHRYALMRQFNVNRRLQLEAVIQYLE